MERRRERRAAYPDDTLEHPKRVAEIPVNPCLRGKIEWNRSTQVCPSRVVVIVVAAAPAVVRSRNRFRAGMRSLCALFVVFPPTKIGGSIASGAAGVSAGRNINAHDVG